MEQITWSAIGWATFGVLILIATLAYFLEIIKPKQDEKKEREDFKSRADTVFTNEGFQGKAKRVEDCPTLSYNEFRVLDDFFPDSKI